MICAFSHKGETYIVKDNDAPNIRLSVFEPENFPLLMSADLEAEPPWYVCSENVIPMNLLVVEEPQQVLGMFRSALATRDSKGGPRPLSEDDKTCCQLRIKAGSPSSMFGTDPATLLDICKAHPAYRGGVGFMSADLISVPLITTLNFIYDIRRFSPKRTGRTRNKLRSFFRLIKPDFLIKARDRMQAGELLTPAEARVLALTYSWQGPGEEFSDHVISTLPHMFLMREWEDYAARFRDQGIDEDTAEDLGAYRTTLRALEFINLTWMAGMNYIELDPFKFFRTREEAECFTDYVESIS